MVRAWKGTLGYMDIYFHPLYALYSYERMIKSKLSIIVSCVLQYWVVW